jgi:hypothetical protein
MTIISATQGTEIGRITVPDQFRKNGSETLSQQKRLGCIPAKTGHINRLDCGPGWLGHKVRPSLKINRVKRTGGVGEAIEHLPIIKH